MFHRNATWNKRKENSQWRKELASRAGTRQGLRTTRELFSCSCRDYGKLPSLRASLTRGATLLGIRVRERYVCKSFQLSVWLEIWQELAPGCLMLYLPFGNSFLYEILSLHSFLTARTKPLSGWRLCLCLSWQQIVTLLYSKVLLHPLSQDIPVSSCHVYFQAMWRLPDLKIFLVWCVVQQPPQVKDGGRGQGVRAAEQAPLCQITFS